MIYISVKFFLYNIKHIETIAPNNSAKLVAYHNDSSLKITGKINKGIETYQEALWNGISCTGETFTKKKSLKIS